MKMKTALASLTALAIGSIPAANASSFKFFSGSGASSAVDSATYVTPTSGLDVFSGDFLGSTLVYNLGGGLTLTVSSSGSGPTSVIQDASPSKGGLGDNGIQNGDNTGVDEFVTLQFNQSVLLRGFFAFWDHAAPNGSGSTISVNGTDYNSNGNDWISVNERQSLFVFRKVEDGNPNAEVGFYVSALDVPEPATLGLFGLGLAAVGFVRRRRVAA